MCLEIGRFFGEEYRLNLRCRKINQGRNKHEASRALFPACFSLVSSLAYSSTQQMEINTNFSTANSVEDSF
jgi:hypothetical protein